MEAHGQAKIQAGAHSVTQWCHRGPKISPCLHSMSPSHRFQQVLLNTYPLCVYVLFSRLVDQLCLTLCDLMDCSTPGFPFIHHLPELAQTHVHWVNDAIQPLPPLLSSSPALNLSQHQGLFQWVSSSHQVAKVLELQLQHQSFQWIFRTDFL